MLKKVIIISDSLNVDVKWIKDYTESKLLSGLNAITVNNVKDAKTIGRLLYKHQLFDIFIFSRHKAVLNTIYNIYPYARLVFMADTFYSLPDLSKQTLASNSNTVCLKAANLSSQMVRRLKLYGITVFAYVEKTLDCYQAILSGVDGIFGEQIDKKAIDITGDFAFPPFVIAHRGMHHDVQENSIKAAKNAVAVSSDFIELDVHMTKDRHIVVNHDETMGRTYEKDYVIKKEKLKALQEIQMTYKKEKTGEVISTLPFFHKQIKDTNTSLLIELKTAQSQTIKRLRPILREMDRPPLLMSFYPFALVHFKKHLKEYSRGFLLDLQNNHMSIPDIIKVSNKYNLIIHPYFKHSKQNLIDILKKRAIMYCPWGANNASDLKNLYLSGNYGINTDSAELFKDAVKYLLVNTRIIYIMGETLDLEVFTDKGHKVMPEVKILFNNPLELQVIDNKIVSATLDGLAYMYVNYYVDLGDFGYTLISDMICVEVKRHA